MILQILDKRILYFNPGRSLDFGKLNRFYTFMDRHPGVLAGDIDRFSDYSSLSRLDIYPEGVRAISEVRSVTTGTQMPSKAVLYSSQPLGLEVARMFETFFHSDRIQLRAMDDLDAALAWLEATDLKGLIAQLGRIA